MAADPLDLFDSGRMERLLALAERLEGAPDGELVRELSLWRAKLKQAGRQIKELTKAQADAIVNAALLMSELEAARSEAESAQREAQLANHVKTLFLASISHELRTPLNGILANSETLQEQGYGPVTKRQAVALKDIETSGRHLLALINDLLDVSKIEAGQIELDLCPVEVDSVCQASLHVVRELSQRKSQRLHTDVDREIGCLVADGRRLKQMLVNLLGNAVKFTPEGGEVGLTVRGHRENRLVRFTVWDTGIGIGEEDRKTLFQPFRQVDSRLARQHSGSGLGLFLVKRFAELHQGNVELESESGKGSRFTISLPWRDDALPPDGGSVAGGLASE